MSKPEHSTHDGAGPRSPSSQQSRRRVLKALASLFAGATAGTAPILARASDLKVGAAAPPLVLHTIDGASIATRDLLGDVVIATFWATWCGPCHEELPLLSEYAARNKAAGLRVLGFSLDGAEDLAAVRAIAAQLRFPVGLLGSAYAGAYGRMWRVPVSFVIDRDGTLADDGWQDPQPTWTSERLSRIVDPLLSRR